MSDSIITFIIGAVIFYLVTRNQIKRNNKYGVQEFDSVDEAIGKSIGESILIWIATTMMTIGFIMGLFNWIIA